MKLSTFKLEDYLGHHEFKAPYLLCCSDAESFSVQEILALANQEDQKKWEELRLGYTEVQGHPELREQIVASFYPQLKSENILCFAGAEEGIYCALMALCQEGDHAIVLTPCYQSLMEIPLSSGCAVTEVALREENQWRIEVEKIKDAIRPNTRCVVVNFPHNPTGQVIDEEELKDLIHLLKEKKIWLFSDEVYRLLGTPKKPWAPPAATLYERSLSLGVMSKALGMAGLRIGWIACQDKSLLKKMEEIKHYTSICNSAPAEILSLIALKNKDFLLQRNNSIVQKNLQLLDQFFQKWNDRFSWVRPEGGCVGFVKYLAQNCNADDFCLKALEQKGVLLLPASVYNVESQHFRIGFGRKNMPEALIKFEEIV